MSGSSRKKWCRNWGSMIVGWVGLWIVYRVSPLLSRLMKGFLVLLFLLEASDKVIPSLLNYFLLLLMLFLLWLLKKLGRNKAKEQKFVMVSHLFFTEDNWHYQQIRKSIFTKCQSLVCSKSVDNIQRHNILATLAVKEVERHEKYLGLSIIIGRSKKGIFCFTKGDDVRNCKIRRRSCNLSPGKKISLKLLLSYSHIYDECF